MKLNINSTSNIPLYKQIIAAVRNAVKSGELKSGDAMPSLKDFATGYGISMETTKKAYNILKKEGMMRGRQGKGYFIDIRKADSPTRILMLVDKLSAYKLAIHQGLTESLSHPADITMNFHNQDISVFSEIVAKSVDEYDYYVIAAHFPPEVKPSQVTRILRSIPNDKLILIDNELPEAKGHIGRVFQDFRTDAARALQENLDAIRKYRRVIIVCSERSLYGKSIYPGIRKMLNENGIRCKVVFRFDPDLMTPGTLFIVISGQLDKDHFTLLREAAGKGYSLGNDIGLISHNDEPVNEFICGGLTCISTDFVQMGRSAAEMINRKEMCSVHNPFRLVRRATL
ncbi:MAG: GntR family transcriptional regulator [Bacteroidales bacterium]|nr:GntR family transcriptional regulator [Bacteroidales bacterium]